MFYLILLAFSAKSVWSYGYDSGGGTPNSCGRPYRAGRMHKPPCNIASEGGYCKDAGENYPWHAVKRFVKENRGLMRRMYGEQPEGTLLREELARISPENVRDRFPRQHQPLDIDNELYKDEDGGDYEDLFQGAENYIKQEYQLKFEGRYMRDEDVLRTKFIYADEAPVSIKVSELKTAPTTTTTRTTTAEGTTTGTTMFTATSATTSPVETSQNDLENSTVASSREADGSSEVTTDFNEETASTTSESEKTTKDTLSTPITTEKTETSSQVNQNAVLFQDMEDGASEKVKVNYKLAGVNACPVKEEVVAPFWANNTRGEVLALLNMYPFEQYVHWEKCSFENKQMYCREGCRCEQQYRLHRLLAYDPQNECKGIFSDWFRFPSCCVCKCYGLPSEFRVTSRSPRNGGVRWFDTGTNEED